MTKIELYNQAALDLINYLEAHKEDIIESNDTFGMLKSVLKEVLDIDDEIEAPELFEDTNKGLSSLGDIYTKLRE